MQLLGASTFHHSPLLIHYIGESRRIKLSFREIKSDSETVMKSIETERHETSWVMNLISSFCKACSGGGHHGWLYPAMLSEVPCAPCYLLVAFSNMVPETIRLHDIYTAMNFYVGWFETFILNSSHVLHYTNCILPLAYFFAWSRANGMLWCKLG